MSGTTSRRPPIRRDVPYSEFVRIMGDDSDDILSMDPWWVTVDAGRIARLDEQYVP